MLIKPMLIKWDLTLQASTQDVFSIKIVNLAISSDKNPFSLDYGETKLNSCLLRCRFIERNFYRTKFQQSETSTKFSIMMPV